MSETAPAVKRRRAAPTQGIIRPYEPRDREAVRDIACKTAFRNKGYAAFFEDREVHADYWTRYYTDYIPHEVKVVEQEGEVIGYFFGCPDHAHHTRIMATRIVPRALGRALWRLGTGQYKQPQTKAYLKHMLFNGSKEAPKLPYDKYPATYHCNILRKGYGRSYYSTMALDFLDDLGRRGIDRLHGHITEPAENGIWLKLVNRFDDKGVDITDIRPTRLFEVVLGDKTPMINMGWAVQRSAVQGWLEWMRDKQRI